MWHQTGHFVHKMRAIVGNYWKLVQICDSSLSKGRRSRGAQNKEGVIKVVELFFNCGGNLNVPVLNRQLL